MAGKALLLKEEGNRYFQEGDYKEAEIQYTRAYASPPKDPTNPKLFTNRASARIKLQAWDSCIDDCIKSIELEPANLKAYYLLAQAQLALHHPNEALSSAMTAYEECLKSPYNPSTSMVSALVLQAKKEKWEAKERERIRRRSEMLRDLEQALKKNADDEFQSLELRLQNGEVSESEGAEERQEVESETNKKIEELWLLFEVADPANMKRRQIPDYMIDNISFEVMHDPVTTKNGQSYDKSTILEHLRRSETDPMTRQPLRHADLRPNLALKQACEEFLENNGWVVDW